jgi:hypothetical protein
MKHLFKSFSLLGLLHAGGLGSALPEAEMENRGAEEMALLPRAVAPKSMPMPRMPELARPGAGCPGQSTLCSSGAPYCCAMDASKGGECVLPLMKPDADSGDKGHVCTNATDVCKQTVICCNNSDGVRRFPSLPESEECELTSDSIKFASASLTSTWESPSTSIIKPPKPPTSSLRGSQDGLVDKPVLVKDGMPKKHCAFQHR